MTPCLETVTTADGRACVIEGIGEKKIGKL
jgi:hypothetical protein